MSSKDKKVKLLADDKLFPRDQMRKILSNRPGEDCDCPVCVFTKSQAPGQPYDLASCPKYNFTKKRKNRVNKRHLIVTEFVLVFCFLFSAFEQTLEAQELSVGTESVDIGDGSRLIIPQGSKVKRIGGQILVESNTEFLSRQLSAMEERIKKMEEERSELLKEISSLKKTLQEVQRQLLEFLAKR